MWVGFVVSCANSLRLHFPESPAGGTVRIAAAGIRAGVGRCGLKRLLTAAALTAARVATGGDGGRVIRGAGGVGTLNGECRGIG